MAETDSDSELELGTYVSTSCLVPSQHASASSASASGSDSDFRCAPAMQDSPPPPSKRARLMPAGPRNAQELHEWATFLIDRFKLNGCYDRFVNNCVQGCKIDTKYSGMGCPEQSLAMITQALLAENSSANFISWSAWERDPLPRRVLLSHAAGPCKPRHVFGDVCDYIPSSVLTELRDLSASYRKQAGEKIGAIKATSSPASLAKRDIDRASDGLARDFVRAVVRLLERVPWQDDQKAWCYRCEKPCDTQSDLGKVCVEIAGTTCVAFSSRGSRLQWMHESAIPFVIWLWQLRQRRT